MKRTSKPAQPAKPSGASYAYKPFSIGAFIKNKLEEKRITPVQFAQMLGVTRSNVYRLFERKWMSVQQLLRISEILGENLLLQYHPNVKPQPHPLQAENAQLKTENELLKQQAVQNQNLEEENKILKAKLEVLEKVMMAKQL